MRAVPAVTLALCSTAMLAAADSWGGAYSLGPAKTNIIEAQTTLVPGTAPPSQAGELFLWPGMSNGTGDLIQTTLEQWPDNSWCGAAKGECKLGSNKLTWTQTVTIAGKVVSTLTSDSGPYMKGWGTGTECNDGCNGTIAAQKYTNTTITLDAADPNFGSTGVASGGTTISGLTSEQGGKVWKIATINIPKMV
ncbi:hypothetical protein FRC06_000572 [Ceratobasidium sp. 370]|nr:hypothetical protein FRC06_000572 [Ceratobasidium sp. 370]